MDPGLLTYLKGKEGKEEGQKGKVMEILEQIYYFKNR